MALRIEDYALIGDTETAALVGRDGSIDWLCLPRFDSPACFAALLGEPDNGRWRIAPAEEPRVVRRRYRPGTLVLETEFELAGGRVRVTDFMPPRDRVPDLLRIVTGLSGRVEMRSELILRFDYGHAIPWVNRVDGRLRAVAGPDAMSVTLPVPWHGEDFRTIADFAVQAGETLAFRAVWHPSHEPAPPRVDPAAVLDATCAFWSDWTGSVRLPERSRELVERSLITLKALTYAPTGGIVAAPTTSLPEFIGGVRNWDYRFCWVRDATLTLLALIDAGQLEEARAWRDWLLRAVAGRPQEMQIMYGPAGERRLTELELPWLAGYEGSRPVRVGNGAHAQFQLDVYGEVMDALLQARDAGLEPDAEAWQVQTQLMEFLEGAWSRPDEGIWEVRGGPRQFVHSKVMAWTAFDRAVRTIERWGMEGPVDRWRRCREAIHAEVLREGFDAERGTFTRAYGAPELDAALLMIPQVGFLAPDDPRVVGTVDAIRRELCQDGFVLRYPTDSGDDGLPPGEGAFLPCSFWLADALALMGRRDEATALFDRLAGLANDVGLLSEEYDVPRRRLVGNFPQALTHVALASSAFNLDRERPAPARQRQQRTTEA